MPTEAQSGRQMKLERKQVQQQRARAKLKEWGERVDYLGR
jgi:hypothetical protein